MVNGVLAVLACSFSERAREQRYGMDRHGTSGRGAQVWSVGQSVKRCVCIRMVLEGTVVALCCVCPCVFFSLGRRALSLSPVSYYVVRCFCFCFLSCCYSCFGVDWVGAGLCYWLLCWFVLSVMIWDERRV